MVDGSGGDGGLAEFDRVFAETRRALESVRRTGPQPAGGAGDAGEQPPIAGEGAAADGQVRAVVGRDGRLTSVRVEPRLLRDGIEVVCEHIVVAVNSALDDLRHQAAEQMTSGAVTQVVDPEVLAGELRELQDASLRQMAVFSQTLNDVVARMRER